MKKLSLFIIASLTSAIVYSQNLDTVYVRHLTFQAQDLAWMIGKNASSINQDSVTVLAFRKIRAAVQAVQNPTWTTNITIDSIPGVIVMKLYQTAKTSNAGEVVNRYTAITNAIAAKTVLSYWIGRVDEALNQDYLRARELGKNILLDK